MLSAFAFSIFFHIHVYGFRWSPKESCRNNTRVRLVYTAIGVREVFVTWKMDNTWQKIASPRLNKTVCPEHARTHARTHERVNTQLYQRLTRDRVAITSNKRQTRVYIIMDHVS